MTEDEKYTDISEKLKKLPRLKASDDFMAKLESRIAEVESEITPVKEKYQQEEKAGILDKISMWVRNPWLAPVMGILIFAFIALYITQFNKHETFNDSKQEIIQQDKNSGTQNPEPEIEFKEKLNDTSPSASESNSEKENSGLKQSLKQYNESELNPPVSVKPESRTLNKTEISDEAPAPVIPEKSSLIKDDNVKGGLDKDNSFQKKETEEKINSDVVRSKSTAPETSAEEQSGRSSEESQEKFEKPIGKNIKDKLNAMNKKNLDSLKKKIDKQ